MNQNNTPNPSTNKTSPAQPPSQESPKATADELDDAQLDGVAGGIGGKVRVPTGASDPSVPPQGA